MAKRYLMDTSAVIKYLNHTLADKAIEFIDNTVDEKSILSFVTEIELQAWNPASDDDLKIYRQFINASEIKGITKDIIQKTIEIRKQSGIKIANTIIAATAIINLLTLIADNDKDFLKVNGLDYLNPKNI